ncbi:hypothetical protein [Synechococcus sp. MU1625]|uniref:hypothetical protein n=1 Tax=Synechococcus sp. MU1625 TaxID=2508347 RepID=UPI001CF87968|nr:hypothetical protein [Synechococcus sp. MU1625]MCB4399498.1 hypothetical protein [Synechococcus sp. MU1625]
MDADFEQHYQAAERAYGLGDYPEAHDLASELWDQLQSASDEQDQSLVLGWRAVVALLLGHIQLHGLQQQEQAALSYQRVLDSEPEATLAALAEQGLELCRSQNSVSAATTTPATDVVLPDLLKDPFLTSDADQASPVQPHVVTAMPWLPSDEEPQPTPTAAPAPTPEPAVTLEPEITTEPADQPPSDEIEPTTQEPAAKDLLEKSWLRRQLQPAIKSPTDSTEPMGLMNRIKGAFARSAGR